MTHISANSRSLSEWLFYLESIHPSTIELGLERVKQVAQRLDLIHFAVPVIMVAGTNGKGSTCAYLEAALLAEDHKVAVYGSPHIQDYRERVRYQGEMLSERQHCEAFAAVEAARQDISLTYFEFGTLAALWLVRQLDLDVAILEIGLGGRLDAVNVVEPDVCVITSIAMDHQGFLGDCITGIGREKAGIMRQSKPAILARADFPNSVAEYGQAVGAKLVTGQKDFNWQIQGDQFSFEMDEIQITASRSPQLPEQNLPTALAALIALQGQVSQKSLEAMLNASLPGRWQTYQQQPLVKLDVAHNPQATAALSERIRRSGKARVRAVVGMLADKDSAASLAYLHNEVTDWYVASLNVPRGAQASQLLAHLPDTAKSYVSVTQAYDAALADCQPDELLVVFGSFYTVSDILTR